MLDISNNQLSGSLPREFGNLQKLHILRISSNNLNGSLPYDLGNCENLIELDLSRNMISGAIPMELTNLVGLQKLLLQENAITGSIPDSLSSLQGLFELQLGDNMLEGAIPKSIGSLHHLSFMLNLSSNRLMGEIPASLGELDKLQILDLSNNNLSGEIPSGLSSMLSLSFVNISFNHLFGSLPSSWARLLSSSPMSFVGNVGLCIEDNLGKACKRGLDHDANKTGKKLVLGVIGGMLVVINLCVIIYLLATRIILFRRALRQVKTDNGTNDYLPHDLTLEEIMEVTEDLDEKYLIGKGGHGAVYKVECTSGKIWAVKKMCTSEVGFTTEIKTLSMVKHRNIVKMAGHCIKGDLGLAVYEYLEGGTLFDLLHDVNYCSALDWDVRYRISLGIAQGLSYLHHDCPAQIVHGDVKSRNILLDSELEPKIADFGTAKIISVSDSSCSGPTRSSIIGTLGYIAPEHGFSTRVDEKSDVYSYGVILLELLCRKLPVDPSFVDGVDIVTWAHENSDKIDDCCPFCFLDEEISYWLENEKCKAVKLLELALSCTQWDRDARPSMREAVDILIKTDSERGLQTDPAVKDTSILCVHNKIRSRQ
ncbi:unnamed protein product [Victoria cruziana]